MELYAGNLYWNKTQQKKYFFEKLNNDINTNVLIVGAGMSGSLCAYVLSTKGIKVTVVEKNKIGEGSSLANTGLLQYCSDKRISEFVKDIGEEKGVLFYKMCLEAMEKLTDIINSLNIDADYELKDSINYASHKRDKKILIEDFKYLKKYKFPSEFLDGDELENIYKIDKSSALKTWHDALVNPYKLIQELTRKNVEQGVIYYEDTQINIDEIKDKKVFATDGYSINYDSIILTTGYTKEYPVIKDKCQKNRTYAFCSTPIKDELWKDKVMIWETRVPYLYFRTTADNRIIVGGLDEETDEVEHDEKKIMKKTKRLLRDFKKIYPDFDIDIQYSWNALFYGSKDGLPFIGRDPKNPNMYYLLGYEGNGTCYSVAGAYILDDLINYRFNIYSDIVKVDR